MKPFDRAAIVVCCILLPFFSLSSSGLKKGQLASGNDPFANKLMRHRPVDADMGQVGRVEQELKQFSRKIAEYKAGSHKFGELQVSDDQLISIDRLNRINGSPVKVIWSEEDPIPIFIQGTRLQDPSPTALGKVTNEYLAQRAAEFLAENARLLRIERPVQEFEQTEFDRDELGLTHIRFQQKYEGLEVRGQDVRVHLNSQGVVEMFNGRYIPTPKFLNVADARIDELTARRIALQALGSSANETLSRKLIYVASKLHPRVAWLVQLRKGVGENWYHFIDAETGETLKRYNHITCGSVDGRGTDLLNQTRSLKVYQIGSTYYMIDVSKPMFNAAQSTLPQQGKGVIYILDARNADSTLHFITSSNPNSWPDRASVSASANGALVFDYYKQVHERNAIDNQGSTMYVVINFKRNYNNAFWNGQQMVFGNGNGNEFSDLAAALDVTAHEMTHGVVERTANLVYENQPGALNESFSDVFGVMFEFWIRGANGNWLLGEDVVTPGVSGDALRDMENPGSSKVAFNGQQPAHMSQFRNLPNTPEGNNGGVHINSGIPNRAFYLFATNAAVGRDKADKVYYRALTKYLTRNSQFVDCRLAVIKAAEDLYGAGGAVATAAGQAFDAVGIGSGASTPPPPTLPPVQGQPYLAVIAIGNGMLYRTTPDGANIQQITTTPLSSRPAPADNGALIFYVDNTNNLRVVSSSGTNDQRLSSQGGFANVAISPNGRYLAVTTIFQIPRIYVFDLQNPGPGDKVFQLYTPTYSQGVTAGTVRFPDRIDWAANSQMLMYDTYNTVVGAGGDTTGYWDINLLRITDGAISRLFPPQPRGIDIGNAVFATNTDNFIAFDFVDENRQVKVLAVNLITGAAGVVTNNYGSLGSPSFSSDDKKVYYHYIDANGASVWVVDLKQDGVTGSGNDQRVLADAVYPVSFTVGSRPTDVESDETVMPQSFSLEQNYPNPFNPSTTIQFSLPRSAYAKLAVYDLLGREIAVLVDQELRAGRHSVRFDAKGIPSGVYVYQLRSGEFHEARKFVVVK